MTIVLAWPAFAAAQTEEPKPEEPTVGEIDDAAANAAARSSFMDTRLNFTFTCENVLADLDESQVPNVPGCRFGRPNSLGTLFFDNYDTRFSGFETMTHAVMYKRHTDRQWDIEGAFVLRINDIAEDTIRLSDAGSYVRVAWWRDPQRRSGERWSLTAFPTSADRFRLGYSYRLSWGGSPEYQRSDNAVPGVKLQWENDKVYAFVGAKSAVLVDDTLDEERAVMAYLGGAGIDVTDMLRVEVNGGYFDRGTNEQEDVRSEHVQLYGVSVQVALQKGIPVGSSIDYKLYRNAPESTFRLYQPEEYKGGLAWMAAAEWTYLGQTLKDPTAPGSTTVQKAMAGDLNFRAKYNFTRFQLDLQMREVAYILHSAPSLPSYVDFSPEFDVSPNIFGAIGVDQHFPDINLTTGVIVGLELPATIESPKPIVEIDQVSDGEAVYVVRAEGDYTILPPGEKVVPQFAAKLTSRLDFANDKFASILDIYYSRDPNKTRLRRDGPEGLLEYEFDDFNQLGFNLALQAKF